MSKEIYKPEFDILKDYLESNYNLKVTQSIDFEDTWYPSIKLITINSNNHWKDRLIALMHESGHVMLDLNATFKKNLKCSGNDSLFTEDYVRSKKQFVSLINEEITAWNLGKKLAVDLNINFDQKRLTQVSTACIMTYIKRGLNDVYGKTINIDLIDPGI